MKALGRSKDRPFFEFDDLHWRNLLTYLAMSVVSRVPKGDFYVSSSSDQPAYDTIF